MSQRVTYLVSIALLAILLVDCSPKRKERPSPLRADSTSFKSGQLAIYFSSPAVTSPDGVDRTGKIWGELVPFDQMWRTGANEATVFKTSVPVRVAGNRLDSGAYSLFTIPSENEWQVIFNENWNQWGTYEYDSTLNAAVIRVRPQESQELSERMKFYFTDDSLIFHWEKLRFSLPLE